MIAGTLGPGGVERQLFYLATALRAMGAAPQVLSFSQGEFWEEKLRQAGVPTACVGHRPVIPLRLRRILMALEQDRSDIVQSAHFYTSLYAITAARLLGLREIGAIRSDLRLEIRKPDPISGRLSLRLLRRIAVNFQAGIEQALRHGVPASRLYHMPNVVDTELFHPGIRRAGGPVRLLTVGRFVREKRHDRLLAILAAVARRCHSNVAMSVVGEGPLRSRFEAEAARLQLLPGNLCLHSTQENVAALYRDADIFLLTSDYEGMPNVILEAMACGLPVVASSVGGIPEIVVERETGFLSPPDSEDVFVDRILTLVHDGRLRSVMGGRGREYVQSHFARATLPARLMKFYDWALGVPNDA